MEGPSHYKLLKLTMKATEDDIRAAYKQQALATHPDKPGGSTTKFKSVQKAYECLRDPALKKEYDAKLLVARRRKAFQPPPPLESVRLPQTFQLPDGSQYVFETAVDKIRSRFRHGDYVRSSDGAEGVIVGLASTGLYWCPAEQTYAVPFQVFGGDQDIVILCRGAPSELTVPQGVRAGSRMTESQRQVIEKQRKARQQLAAKQKRERIEKAIKALQAEEAVRRTNIEKCMDLYSRELAREWEKPPKPKRHATTPSLRPHNDGAASIKPLDLSAAAQRAKSPGASTTARRSTTARATANTARDPTTSRAASPARGGQQQMNSPQTPVIDPKQEQNRRAALRSVTPRVNTNRRVASQSAGASFRKPTNTPPELSHVTKNDSLASAPGVTNSGDPLSEGEENRAPAAEQASQVRSPSPFAKKPSSVISRQSSTSDAAVSSPTSMKPSSTNNFSSPTKRRVASVSTPTLRRVPINEKLRQHANMPSTARQGTESTKSQGFERSSSRERRSYAPATPRVTSSSRVCSPSSPTRTQIRSCRTDMSELVASAERIRASALASSSSKSPSQERPTPAPTVAATTATPTTPRLNRFRGTN